MEITAVGSSNHSGQTALLLGLEIVVSYLSTLAIPPKVTFWHFRPFLVMSLVLGHHGAKG